MHLDLEYNKLMKVKFKNMIATLLEPIKLVLRTWRTLKTNIKNVFKALLTKLGIYNKYTAPLFNKLGIILYSNIKIL